MKILGTAVWFLAVTALASAVAAPVPEIDGSSVATGIVLVCGALLIARGRRK